MNRKQKFKYFRTYIKKNKIKDGKLKSAIYGIIFNFPKKINKYLKLSDNNINNNYLIYIQNKFINKKS